MRAAFIPPAVLALALIAAPAAAGNPPLTGGAEYVPGEVIVKYNDETASQALAIEDGESVAETVEELQADPNVAYAVPNYIAHASALIPNDPAINLQWNLFGPFGINMPEAWDLARGLGAPGGRGTVVAVLDTGVAYRTRGRFRRAPDLHHFVRGYDFVDEDRFPFDLNGHGTHVSGTIAESTNNGKSAAGVAYRAKIMPLRVLDADGAGDTIAISRAIRYAARHKAHVINLSLEFDSSVRASQIPDIVSALRFARRRGVVVVAAAGNQADGVVAYPARAANVIAVGATTERGCQADYSNGGRDLDVAAPGGGVDVPVLPSEPDYVNCRPDLPGRDIFQQTFTRNVRTFGLPGGYEGTSMASPHVAGVAALVIATRKVPPRSPRAVEQHLEATVRDLGVPGFDERYGWGLVDAANALR
jgi:serine protease